MLWHVSMDERYLCSTFDLLQDNFQAGIRSIVREFRRPPGLNDAVIRRQFKSLAEDISIPRRKFSAHFSAHLCWTAGHCCVSLAVEPCLVNLQSARGNDGRDRIS